MLCRSIVSLKPRQGREPGRGGWAGAGFAAQENAVGEGIGWFAAKRGDVADGRARGIEAKMIFGEKHVPWPVGGSVASYRRQRPGGGFQAKIIVANSPTARRQTIAMMELVTVLSDFATFGSVVP